MSDGLFKAIKKSDGEWVTGSLINNMFFTLNQEPIPYIMTNEINYDCWEDIACCMDEYEVLPDTILKSTEMKDRDGEIVWEKDVILHGAVKLMVLWDTERSLFVLSDPFMGSLIPINRVIVNSSKILYGGQWND